MTSGKWLSVSECAPSFVKCKEDPSSRNYRRYRDNPRRERLLGREDVAKQKLSHSIYTARIGLYAPEGHPSGFPRLRCSQRRLVTNSITGGRAPLQAGRPREDTRPARHRGQAPGRAAELTQGEPRSRPQGQKGDADVHPEPFPPRCSKLSLWGCSQSKMKGQRFCPGSESRGLARQRVQGHPGDGRGSGADAPEFSGGLPLGRNVGRFRVISICPRATSDCHRL